MLQMTGLLVVFILLLRILHVISVPAIYNSFKRVEATYIRQYKLSGADKNIGAVVAIAAYLLGDSSSNDNVKTVAENQLNFYQCTLFGGADNVRTGLRMIAAFYYRDYNLLREIYLDGRNPAETQKITKTLQQHEDRGSFPTGTLLAALPPYTSICIQLLSRLVCFILLRLPNSGT
jgi:hypothetical protein